VKFELVDEEEVEDELDDAAEEYGMEGDEAEVEVEAAGVVDDDDKEGCVSADDALRDAVAAAFCCFL